MSKFLKKFKQRFRARIAFLCTGVVIFTTLMQPNFVKSTPVFAEDFFTGCEPGYYINPDSGRCKKIKVCNFGFSYDATTNTCHEIQCPFGSKLSEDGSACHPVTCNEGYILSTAGNCISRPAKIEGCENGFAYNSTKRSCIEAPEIMDDSVSLKNCSMNLDETIEIHSIAEKASDSGHDKELIADISAPEYADLRDIISDYFKEQERLEEEEDALNKIPDESDQASFAGEDSASEQNPAAGASNSPENPDIAESSEDEDKLPACPDGKVYNPFTGRCKTRVSITETNTSVTTSTFNPETGETDVVKTCKTGYVLNEETNRCNKVSSSSASTSKTCPAGQYLNPLTNRCKKLVTTTQSATSTTTVTFDPITGETTTVKTCIDGYELNEETNRCIKIKENSGADFALDVPKVGDIEASPKTFIAISIVVALAVIGIVAAIISFRQNIIGLVRRCAQKLKGGKHTK